MRFSATRDDQGRLHAEIDVRPAEVEFDQARRARLVEEARRAGRTEFRREDLQFGRFGVVTDRDGRKFRVHRGAVPDPAAPWSAVRAFVVTDDSIVWLESAG